MTNNHISPEYKFSPESMHTGNRDRFNIITPDDIPLAVSELLSDRTSSFINEPGLKPEEFELLLSVKHPNGTSTFFATYEKENEDSETELNTLVVDIDESSAILGRGEIRFLRPETNPSKASGFPFVGFTHTEDGSTEKGLGTQRLRLMNDAANIIYGMPLSSGFHPTPKAESLWLKLVEKGLAVSAAEATNRYTFVTSNKNKDIAPVPQIDLVQGRDFENSKDYSAIFGAIVASLGELSLKSKTTLVAGYDAATDTSRGQTTRDQTFALTLKELQNGINGMGTNAIQYAGIGKKWSEQPSLGVYDATGLIEHPGENRYSTSNKTSLDAHKVAEIRFYTPEQR